MSEAKPTENGTGCLLPAAQPHLGTDVTWSLMEETGCSGRSLFGMESQPCAASHLGKVLWAPTERAARASPLIGEREIIDQSGFGQRGP